MEDRVRALDGFWSRSARLRNHQAKRAAAKAPLPSQPLEIGPLISPLRFDILTRVEYFRFLEANMALATSQWRDYVELAMTQPYYAWFRAVAVARRRFAKLTARQQEFDERRIRHLFEWRLKTSNALYLNFIENGFDSRRPLILRNPSTVLPTDTGKVVQREVFVTDGCHRLALLMFAGAREISPAHYRLIPHKSPFRPIDNTSIMLQRTSVSMEQYVAFLALGYGAHAEQAPSALCDSVDSCPDAQTIHEIKAVLSHDLVLLAQPRP